MDLNKVSQAIGNVAGIAGGVSSVFGSLGNFFGSNDDDYYRKAQDAFNKQRQLMSENNAYQSSENEKGREFQRQMYEKEFSDVTNWNDYKNMVKRAQDAGISPSALFQSGAPAQFGGLSAPSTSHSAIPSPSYEGVVNPVDRQAESFHSVASGLQALAQAQKAGVETTQVAPLMSAQIKNQLSEAGLNSVRASSEDFEFGLRKIYGKKLYDSELGRNYAQMINDYSQAYLYAEQGNTQESVRLLNRAERLYKDALRDSTNKQIEMVNMQLAWYPQEMKAKINNYNASSEESRASAQNYTASAVQTKIFNKFYSDRRYAHSFITQVVEQGRQAVKQTDISEAQVKQLNYMVEQAAFSNDMKEFTYWSNQVTNFVGTLGQAASQFYGAGALRELMHIRQGAQQSPTPVRGFTP